MSAATSHPSTIVIVDDEPVVTQTIRSVLTLETDYDVHTFNSPVDALRSLESKRADLVLSDFLMPDLNGIEFLSEVKRRWPETVRVLLTGYADKENAIRAINEIDLYQYLEKPWDNDQLVMVIKNGLRQQSLDTRLRDKIRELDRTLLDRDRISRAHEAIKEELVLARRVQEAMLPSTFPRAGGLTFHALYEPALDVGGDFYDVVQLDDHRVALFVADATGHGIQAALTTTLIRAAFNEVSRVTNDVRDILLQMNDVIHRALPTGMFVAATAALVDTRTGEVRIIGGGGPNPLLLRSDGRLEQVVSTGLPLGVVESAVYPPADEASVILDGGATLLIFTDGLSEVDGEDEAQFGETELSAALTACAINGVPAREVGPYLLESARRYATRTHAWDDVTALILSMKKS